MTGLDAHFTQLADLGFKVAERLGVWTTKIHVAFTVAGPP